MTSKPLRLPEAFLQGDARLDRKELLRTEGMCGSGIPFEYALATRSAERHVRNSTLRQLFAHERGVDNPRYQPGRVPSTDAFQSVRSGSTQDWPTYPQLADRN